MEKNQILFLLNAMPCLILCGSVVNHAAVLTQIVTKIESRITSNAEGLKTLTPTATAKTTRMITKVPQSM